MRLMAVYADRHEVHRVVATPEGKVVARDSRPGPVVLDLVRSLALECDACCLALPLGDPRDRETAEGWAAALGGSVWLASARETLLAGALAWQPGLVVSEDFVMTRDSTGRRQVWPHPGGLAVLAGQLREAAQAVPRLASSLAGSDLELARRLLEFADFPGPEPACKAAVARTAREVCDTVRYGLGRSGFTEPPRAVLSGPQWREPLADLLVGEIKRHAPQLRWHPARFPGVGGALLLLTSQLAYLRRQRPDEALALAPGVGWIGEEAWRQLGRERRPLPAWG